MQHMPQTIPWANQAKITRPYPKKSPKQPHWPSFQHQSDSGDIKQVTTYIHVLAFVTLPEDTNGTLRLPQIRKTLDFKLCTSLPHGLNSMG